MYSKHNNLANFVDIRKHLRVLNDLNYDRFARERINCYCSTNQTMLFTREYTHTAHTMYNGTIVKEALQIEETGQQRFRFETEVVLVSTKQITKRQIYENC